MSSRLIRLLLVVFAIAAGVAASYLLSITDHDIARSRGAADGLREQSRALLGTLSDVRAAQVGYVARGQREEFWMTRVAKLLPTLDQQMEEFRAALSSPSAQADFDPAVAAVENFQKLDARAQEYVKSNESALASDLIFSDGLEAMNTAAAQARAALDHELEARSNLLTSLRTRELMTLGGGAGAVLLVLMLLGFTGAAEAPSVEEAPAETIAPRPIAAPETPKSPSLTNVAQLCTDLARVQESKQLPALLERAARTINASGIIVWLADQDGRELRPAMSFGYSDQDMARMGMIPRDAANAAAAAYRSAEMRTVTGDGKVKGALVAPLIAPDGCIGVLSAEMKGGSEKDKSSQDLASIVAAQLATLVSPPPNAELLPAAAQA